MAPKPHPALFWLPRVLGILFALFLSLFAFDVFEMSDSIWEVIAAFLIHLIPTYLVLIAVAIGWRRPWLGALLFAGLAVLYVLVARGEMFSPLVVPLLAIGLLFLLDWRTNPPVQLKP